MALIAVALDEMSFTSCVSAVVIEDFADASALLVKKIPTVQSVSNQRTIRSQCEAGTSVPVEQCGVKAKPISFL